MADTKTPRTRLRRLPKRGAHDRPTIDAILDEALVCHVGFVHDGHPFVIPTLHARIGDDVLIHGSAASRALKALGQGLPVCLTATLIDGLVLARSAFHHSVNYRSVVLLGEAREVTDPVAKSAALEAFTERMVPGRWEHIRWPSPQELKGTKVLTLAIDEASAKVRSGPPGDDEPDYEMDVWAGVIPLHTAPGEPQDDPLLRAGIPVPGHVRQFVA